MNNQPTEELKRSLGFWSAISIVVGTIIGSGIFFKQGSVLDSAGSSTLAIAAWVFGGIITLTGGLTIAEIGAQMPYTGGLYVYIENLYGRILGFLAGWMQIIIYGPAIIASVAGFMSILMANFFGLGTAWRIPLAVITVLAIGVMNLFENKVGAIFAIITTTGKMIPIAAIIIFGLLFGNQHAFGQTVTEVQHATGGFGVAVLATLFGYDGWILIANLGGEMKNPQRLLPRAIILGITAVLVIYTLITIGILKFLPANLIHHLGENATAYLATKAFGAIGGKLLSAGIIISMMGTLNGKNDYLPADRLRNGAPGRPAILAFSIVCYAQGEVARHCHIVHCGPCNGDDVLLRSRPPLGSLCLHCLLLLPVSIFRDLYSKKEK